MSCRSPPLLRATGVSFSPVHDSRVQSRASKVLHGIECDAHIGNEGGNWVAILLQRIRFRPHLHKGYKRFDLCTVLLCSSNPLRGQVARPGDHRLERADVGACRISWDFRLRIRGSRASIACFEMVAKYSSDYSWPQVMGFRPPTPILGGLGCRRASHHSAGRPVLDLR